MSFWGVEVKPNEPYTLDIDGDVVLMLTQATLGVGSSPKKSTLQVKVGDNEPIFLCTLLPEKAESFLLNLEFDEDEDVIFSVVGPTSIHLSGILGTPPEEEEGDDYSDGDFGEDIPATDSEDNEFGSEDDSDDDSMDAYDEDDAPMLLPSGARKSGVVIEEIEEEEKPVSEGSSKQSKKKKELPSNEKTPLQIKGKTDDVKLESEDKDGFPASGSTADKGKSKKNKNVAKDDGKSTDSLKRKADAIDQDKEPKSDEGKKKKRKNKNKAKIEKDETEANTSKNAVDEVASVKQGKKEKNTTTPVKEEKKTTTPVKEEKKTTTPVKEQKQQPKEKPVKKTFPNGLIIEDLEVGKPNGRKASSGKKVSVRYIGMLKKNNKIFDSNLSGKPFKFRLGAGEVIKGWDVGVVGMQVGGKRRIIIPPSMGYGASGSPPVIPPNAWLSFDVTLVDVA